MAWAQPPVWSESLCMRNISDVCFEIHLWLLLLARRFDCVLRNLQPLMAFKISGTYLFRYASLIFVINLLIQFVSLAGLGVIHFLSCPVIFCHCHHSQHPLLPHSVTCSSNPTFSTNPSNRNRPWYPGLPSRIIRLDRTYHAHCLLSVPCWL